MANTTRKWVRVGALLAWVAVGLSLSLANACSDATAPRIPPPVDSTGKDTIKTSLVIIPELVLRA